MADIVDLIYAEHDYFRRYFFLLDQAHTVAEKTAIWEPLATRLDAHAQAEEEIVYPVLLRSGGDGDGDAGAAGDPSDETADAVGDHNKIRDAVREARRHPVGSAPWQEAVDRARAENGQHMDEEEREALPDFLKTVGADQRHALAMRWLLFYYRHPGGHGADQSDKDVKEYLKENR